MKGSDTTSYFLFIHFEAGPSARKPLKVLSYPLHAVFTLDS